MNAARFHSVTPILQVENLRRAIEFYTTIMGFTLAGTWGAPPDRASLCRDAVEITLEEQKLGEAARLSHVYLQVENIDEYVNAIMDKGARVTVPLADRVYGMRDCRILDPDKNQLQIGQELPAT